MEKRLAAERAEQEKRQAEEAKRRKEELAAKRAELMQALLASIFPQEFINKLSEDEKGMWSEKIVPLTNEQRNHLASVLPEEISMELSEEVLKFNVKRRVEREEALWQKQAEEERRRLQQQAEEEQRRLQQQAEEERRIAAEQQRRHAEELQKHGYLQIENGIVKGFNPSLSAYQRAQYQNLVIPSEAWGRPVTIIAQGAFANQNINSVTIPNTVTTIGDGAFMRNRITSIIIPDSVRWIGVSAFADNKITRITIGADVTIEESAFAYFLEKETRVRIRYSLDGKPVVLFSVDYNSTKCKAKAGTYELNLRKQTWVLTK